ncbi:hypothetical protein CHS0354_030611 [Potamilus streckersoni]|uniref:Uncharacterized protein n=1 Tax=Potamilus streckersoni TaxID=2493646 RepID=A0AAE0SD58_9BIVA|nr:hypothetical protein CHS0354_030611 [Potamilus streckersoni]
MCRFGCTTTSTTYMCKWCGTRYCKECLRGEFVGAMSDPNKCRVCNQTRCQGQRVEYVPRQNKEEEDGKVKKRGTSALSSRSRSAKSVKSNKSGKSKKSGKKSGKKSSGKKKKKKK